ncbi:MAG: hypothetical protein ACO3NK_04190 [Prochlorotrichaceae cyanobacterium]|jgi:hypothetical protein
MTTEKIDRSKLVTKLNDYQIATSQAVLDVVLMGIASDYESSVSRKMISLNANQLDRRFPTTEPILETTKFDGEGIFIYFERGSQIFAFNAPSGRVRVGLPALKALEEHLLRTNLQKGLFRAELYLPLEISGRRAGIADVLRVSFNGTEAELNALKLVMIDLIMVDGKDLRSHQSDFEKTWTLLQEYFGDSPSAPFFRPEGSILPENQIADRFATKTAAGAEGLVLRRLRRAEVYKVKPQLSIDAIVIGYVEGEYEGQYGMTSLLVALTYPIENPHQIVLQTLLRVGSGFSDAQRSELLTLLSQWKVEAPLPMTDNDGRPILFVKPHYIVELNCEDIMVNMPGSDRDNRTQAFLWNADSESYQFLGLQPCPRPIFATFLRFRDDKELLNGGARLEQIVPSPQLPQDQPERVGKAEIIRREVYQKGDMIRKLVMVQTNNPEAIPYLVYWTDFSPKRKSPLDVSVSYAYTLERAHQLAENLIETKIVRGWKKV